MKNARWTEQEIENLKNGILPTNRTQTSIMVMKRRLGLVSFKKPVWTSEHKVQLKQLLSEGKTTKQISEILPYTQRSIQKEIVRQKIPHNNIVRFTELEKIFFCKFLSENFAQKTTRELVDLWNRDNKRKVNEKKVVIYLKKLNLKISKAEVIKMTWLRKREQEWLQEKDLDSIRARRVQIMSERYKKQLDLWTALPSHEIVVE
jgi:hypothetical protein